MEDKTAIYYQALLDRNPAFTGIFFAAVKTTGVFCLSTCRARKPLRENVEFFSTFREALAHGYRPCKICHPTENAHEAPEPVKKAIQMVKSQPKEKISDQILREQALNPEQIRRWFKQHYGMTFQAFQRMFRINEAFQEIKNGQSTTATAFEFGYESLSGFGYTYKKLIGRSPRNSLHKNLIRLSRLTTPIGPMFVAATEQGICLLEFTDRRMLETEFRDLQRLLKAHILAGENQHILQAKLEINEYFAGKRQQFELPLHAPGTPFQHQMWQSLQEIPYGQTTTYQHQALKIGRPNAVRAVASANGHNRIAIVIPCHRVIASNGDLTGYGGGLERKRWLLDLERNSV